MCACLLAWALQVVNSRSISSFARSTLAWHLACGGLGSLGKRKCSLTQAFRNAPPRLARPPSAGVSADDRAELGWGRGAGGKLLCQVEGGQETLSHTSLQPAVDPIQEEKTREVEFRRSFPVSFLDFSPNRG